MVIELLASHFRKMTGKFIHFFQPERNESKKGSPTAFFPLKLTHVFGRAARRALRALCGAALSSKNAPDFLHAPDMRSDLNA